MGSIRPKRTRSIDYVEQTLKNRIFGQDHVIDHVIEMLSISLAGLGDDTKPIASFLFTGPTGVGKTELAKELAQALNKKLIRFDMSEYADEYSARNLTGGSAGLVGYEEGGLLTNAVREAPNCVLLLDEIEKAHQKIFNSFLQVLDYGTLTDTKGNKADFTKAVIIMTSNLGAREQNGIGFGNKDLYKHTAVLEFLSPEFRNRLDKIVEFNKLTPEMVVHITDKFIKDFSTQLSKRGIRLVVTSEAKDALNEIGFDPNMGARSVLRAINTEFKQKISRMLLDVITQPEVIVIDYTNEQFSYVFRSSTPSLFDVEEVDYDFATAEEAQEYAKKHLGTVITRSPSRVGYIKL